MTEKAHTGVPICDMMYFGGGGGGGGGGGRGGFVFQICKWCVLLSVVL